MPLRMRPVFTWMVPPSCNWGRPPCRPPAQHCYVELKGSIARLTGLLSALNVGDLTSENQALMHPSLCHCAGAAISNPSRQLDVLRDLHPPHLHQHNIKRHRAGAEAAVDTGAAVLKH
jgi:hypothetical protein